MPLLAEQVENYRNRISGPLLDRIDIHVEAPAVEYKELSSEERAESSEAIRERVLRARKLQQERFGNLALQLGPSHSLRAGDDFSRKSHWDWRWPIGYWRRQGGWSG